MAAHQDEGIATLNGLIETCKDGENGFRTAAGGLDDPSLKTLFQAYSRQRADYARELQAQVRQQGGDPEKSGSFAGSLHRGWINIKSVVTGKDRRAILAECERGEESAVRNYEDALKKVLPADAAALVRRQYAGVKEARDRIRSMEVAQAGR